jgi:3-oxoacyl-[acyl-carrier-protein] synthase-3
MVAIQLQGDAMHAKIKTIAYYLPEKILTNEELAADFPDWPAEKIKNKLGIVKRHLCEADECASDLAIKATQKLFATGACDPQEIEFILFCSQTPDYFLPTTACILQQRLGISNSAGALDFNLGCSGYVYGLSLAKGLIETGQANNVLLITAETYSKFIRKEDKNVRTIFGDGAAATFIEKLDSNEITSSIGPFVFGTDGAGANDLIVKTGGFREPRTDNQPLILTMDGPKIFSFSVKQVPESVNKLLKLTGHELNDIDLFVFHQANAYMLEHLRDKLNIPSDKFLIDLENQGNTVSASIPIALANGIQQGKIRSGQLIMLVGFGVGLSWAATLIRI